MTEQMSKMMHRMSGLQSRPAMKETEMQKQMGQMRKQMDEMMRDPSMKSAGEIATRRHKPLGELKCVSYG